MMHYHEIRKAATSDTCTHNIRVTTESYYVPEQSDPRNNHYFFAYNIRIANEGSEPARLLTRNWTITDGVGQKQIVRGSGVVGKQPRLEPGESFVYSSACPLPTPTGQMRGRYHMVRDDGESFDVAIGEFRLLAPLMLN